MLVLAVAGSSWAQGVKVSTLRVESTPSAAEVEVIGGKAGVTPLTIDERDIYPNNYPDDRVDLYGTVVLRHPGCEPLRHRVTLGDIRDGLQLRLNCEGDAAPPAQAAAPSALPAPATATATTEPGETMSKRRLRQLQVLQELLDEGLISPPEEQRVRRRILQLGPDLD